MSKQPVIRKQQISFMLYNFIAFSIIFTLFGVIVFSQMKSTLLAKVDEELTRNQEIYVTMPDILPGKDFMAPPPNNRPINRPSPRIIPIKWNDEGQIVNIEEIGKLFYDNYFTELQFNPRNLGVISSIILNNSNHFRTITIEEHVPDNQVAYVQLLINTDGEQSILANFQNIIILCTIVFILLSISASYLLSRQTMKPIMRSWNKQAEFVENASHELRTPLTIIQNKMELLLTTPDKKIIDSFEQIALSLSETRRLSKLTTDLLTLARADSTETELTKQPLNIDAFIQSVSVPYIEIAELQDKRIWLQLDCNQTIEADHNRMHQLLVILLDNAIKYTGENDFIGIKTFTQDNRVLIEVRDTGVGIHQDNREHVFDRFYREDKARSRESGGSGLGLSIAQWIVTSHHGTIRALPNEPKGTIIRIKLPK
ncbi:HAMP domain-containing histidine kinase [Paenibacillus albiflavus]|uniref:histidine kinase n=1 Tax=Paenibacillus albiflavus TaxID=2545760 RepID=A0A4R4E213_9BACL|nr:HAMP domain-containing histidine kinase [Paenibacillus albiflavus]TCZ73544.1 HAMP domain-containing histidine kinase [Paenibacillus albiflavus]